MGITQRSRAKGFTVYICPDQWALSYGAPNGGNIAVTKQGSYIIEMIMSTKLKVFGSMQRVFEKHGDNTAKGGLYKETPKEAKERTVTKMEVRQ